MNRYTIPCTEEQTMKALKLGAPIEIEPYDNPACVPQKCPKIIAKYPTAEQMLGWLVEQRISAEIVIPAMNIGYYSLHGLTEKGSFGFTGASKDFHSRKDATLAAIDAALEYLEKNK